MAEYNPSKIIKDGNTYNFRDTTKIPLAGTNALAGSIVPSTNNAYDFGNSSHNFKIVYAKEVRHGLSSGSLVLSGGNGTTNGANLVLYGTNRSDGFQGRFDLVAKGSSDYKLTGLPSGTLTWGSKNVAMAEDVIPRSGGAVLDNYMYSRSVNYDVLRLTGGTAWANGAGLALFGKDRTSDAGVTFLKADNGTSFNQIALYPNGMFIQNVNETIKHIAMQEDVIPRSGGAVLEGQEYKRTVDSSTLNIYGGNGYGHGAFLQLTGKDEVSAGDFNIQAHDGTNSTILKGKANGTLTWNGQPIQTSSDKRLKQQITEIDDKLLDAWEDVELSQFKYNDAVDQKKDKARLHTGYVVQQIDKACQEHGVDISAYGLYCHEEYPEETEEVEVEQQDGTKVKERKVIREASEHYSLRYTEALIVECAYLRKKLKELTARIEELEKGNKKVEK